MKLSTILATTSSSISSNTITKIVKPVLDVCEAVLTPMISIVGAIGLLYSIILGVKYARADDPQEHEKAKSGLKNAIIGFVLIFVLMIACKIATNYLQYWVVNYQFDQMAID